MYNQLIIPGTNLYGGIEHGVSLLDTFHNSRDDYNERSLSMIILLSDGQPTDGITNLNQIKEKTKELINGRYSLFTLRFGNDVDHEFLCICFASSKCIHELIHSSMCNLLIFPGTNFYGGIEQGVSLLDTFHNSRDDEYIKRSLSMIIILSDGKPENGITNLNLIKEKTKELINGRYSLFTLGFGNDVDHEFLEKLAGQNSGIFRKILVDSDSSLQLTGFFDDVATPLLLNVQFSYQEDVVDNNAVTDTRFPSYFKGSELVVAGKLMDELVDAIDCNVLATTTEYGTIGIRATGSVEVSRN